MAHPRFLSLRAETCQTIWSQISCLGILQLSRLQSQVIDGVWQHYTQKIVSVLSQGTRDCSNQCYRLFPSFFERHFKQRWDFHLTALYGHRKCCFVFKRFYLLGEKISMCMRGYVKACGCFVWLHSSYRCGYVNICVMLVLVSYVLLQKCEGKKRLHIKRKSLWK